MKKIAARRVFCRILPLVLAIFLLFPVCETAARGTGPKLPHPGFRSIGLWDQSIPLRMDIAVWYPSSRLPGELLLEGWSIYVSRNGAGTPGKYPVILLSHGTAGSRLASHDLAAALARHGFMVIAPTHPTDNMDDTGGIHHAALFADRPRQLLLALMAVEQSPVLRPLMDRGRVGVLGVGAGAATALQLAGARPDLSRLASYCPDAPTENPLCSNWAKAFHPRMQAEFAALLAKEPETFTPALHVTPEQRSNDANSNNPAQVADNGENAFFPAPDLAPDPGEIHNPTAPPLETQPVLAVGLLTPRLVALFPDESLQALTAPVGILTVSDDAAHSNENSLDRLQKLLRDRPASRELLHAGYFDVQAPCPPMFLDSFPALCGETTPGADDFRQMRNEFFIRFFQKNLGFPIPPPLLPENRPS